MIVQPIFRLAQGRDAVREQLVAAAAMAIAVRFDERGILMEPADCWELAGPFAEREIAKIEERLALEQRTWAEFDETDVLQVDWSKLHVAFPPDGDGGEEAVA